MVGGVGSGKERTPRREVALCGRKGQATQLLILMLSVGLCSTPAFGRAGIDVSVIEDGPTKPVGEEGEAAIPWTEEPLEWWYDGGVTAEVHFVSKQVETPDGGVSIEVRMVSATIDAVIYYTVGQMSGEIAQPTFEGGLLYDDEKPVVFTRNGYIKAVAFHLYSLDSPVTVSPQIRVKIKPPQMYVLAGDLHPLDTVSDPDILVPLEQSPPLASPAGASFVGAINVYAVARSSVAPFTPNIQLTVGGKQLVLAAPAGVGTATIIVTSSTRVRAVAWQDGLDTSDEVESGLLTITPGADGRKAGFAGLLGWYDLGLASFHYGNYSRPADVGCGERFETLVTPARVVDRQGTLGPAVLMGPGCKGGRWDIDVRGQSACEVHKVQYRADAGCTVRGGVELIEGVGCAVSRQPSLTTLSTVVNSIGGLQFDPMINRGVYVSNDVDEFVNLGRLPTSALSIEVQFLVAPQALASSRMYGLLSCLHVSISPPRHYCPPPYY